VPICVEAVVPFRHARIAESGQVWTHPSASTGAVDYPLDLLHSAMIGRRGHQKVSTSGGGRADLAALAETAMPDLSRDGRTLSPSLLCTAAIRQARPRTLREKRFEMFSCVVRA
jgi:hypothetical protein